LRKDLEVMGLIFKVVEFHHFKSKISVAKNKIVTIKGIEIILYKD